MRLGPLNRRIAELERQIVSKMTLLRLPNGRTFGIRRREAPHIFCMAMDVVGKAYTLSERELATMQLTPELLAIVEAEPDSDWPPLLHTARSLLTDCGKYLGRGEVLEFLRRKVHQ